MEDDEATVHLLLGLGLADLGGSFECCEGVILTTHRLTSLFGQLVSCTLLTSHFWIDSAPLEPWMSMYLKVLQVIPPSENCKKLS